MITRLGNFVTLQNGSGKQLNPMDPGYSDFLVTMAKQKDAASTNLTSSNDYMTKLHNYQISLDAGRGEGLTAPTKPKMTVVDDLGNTTEVDFVPALPDARPITPPNGGPIVTNAPATTDLVNSKLDGILQLLSFIASKLSSK